MIKPPVKPLQKLNCDTNYRQAQKIDPVLLDELLVLVPNWIVPQDHAIDKLTCRFGRENFADAIKLAAAIGVIADMQNHHPTLLVEWGALTVTWWTHSLDGLHLNDFIMAAKTNQIATKSELLLD